MNNDVIGLEMFAAENKLTYRSVLSLIKKRDIPVTKLGDLRFASKTALEQSLTLELVSATEKAKQNKQLAEARSKHKALVLKTFNDVLEGSKDLTALQKEYEINLDKASQVRLKFTQLKQAKLQELETLMEQELAKIPKDKKDKKAG